MAIRTTQQTLRRCMIKLMRKKKLSKIRLDEICELAQIGKRTFYNYYSDKYELFEDTYVTEYYNKLGVEDDMISHEIVRRIIHQMYEDQDFFTHAIAMKEQNGFWELLIKLVVPHIYTLLPGDPRVEDAKLYYVQKDMELKLYHIEQWIEGGYQQTPEELFAYIMACTAYHGEWKNKLAVQFMESMENGES